MHFDHHLDGSHDRLLGNYAEVLRVQAFQEASPPHLLQHGVVSFLYFAFLTGAQGGVGECV